MNTCAACDTLLGPTARWVTVLRDPQFLVITTGSRLLGGNFFASNECRDRGGRPRRVAESRGRPPVGAGLTKATQVIPEMRVLGNNALDS